MEIDTLDRQLIHALGVDGRAPFSAIAGVLGVSDQTVARRYRQLREHGGLRVVGMPDGVRLGYDRWLIRLRATADAAAAIGDALARRPDTTWVNLHSGGTEIACVVQNPNPADREALLLQKLPRTPRVVSVTAHCLIHQFAGGPVDLDGPVRALTRAQVARLRPAPVDPAEPARLDPADEPLLAALARDGRAGYPELARLTGWSESTVRRRLDQLRRSGALYLDVDVDPVLVGFPARVMLCMAVAPAHLAAVGTAMARQPEVVFAAATTGTTNLVATVICPDMAGLYTYLTERIGPLPGVERVETSPTVRHLKRVAALP